LTRKFSSGAQYLISIVVVCAVAGLGYFTQDIFGYRSVALMLLMAVSVLAMLFKIWPVLLAATMSALIWDYFFIPPRFQITVHSAEDLLLLLMYFVIVMLNAVLTYNLRKIEKQTQQKEEREKTIGLYNSLLNSLSHELRTPIATIVGATDTLKENSAQLSEKNKTELFGEISKASLRLDKQVGNLLNMSRLQSGIIQPRLDWTDANELIHQVIKKLSKDYPSQKNNLKHRIHVQINGQLPLVKIDGGLIEQALYNILNNALIYTPENSSIEILAETENFIETENSTGLEYMNHFLVLKIADNGPGFPEQEINKVFDKFYRLNSSKTGGTGLGLSISKGFIEAHRGTITLKNRPEGGAEFTIKIPVQITNVNRMKND
jgi:two-component system, OmpR family, sensor histidine kinase KdpD